MHTPIVILAGLVLLGVCLGVGHALGGAVGTARGALAFLPLWLVGSGINMYVGLRGGRTAAEEIPYLFLVFAIPAVAAFVAWWKLPHWSFHHSLVGPLGRHALVWTTLKTH